MDNFIGFTPRAQKMINIFAHQEARRLSFSTVLPEHLFLALLRDGEGLAVKVLKFLGVDLDEIRREVESSLRTRASNVFILGSIPLSVRFKNVIEIAKQESMNLGHNYVGTEHLLLAIAAEENIESIIPVFLKNREIGLELLRQVVIKLVGYGEVSEDKIQKKKQAKTPFLDKFAKNLTYLASQKLLDPVIGREKEVQRVIQVLCRRQKNNPILIGEAGVGKTAIVEKLAQLIFMNMVPEKLRNKRIMLLDIGLIVAGTKYRGEFEERMKNIIKEVEDSDDVILFIDEIHTIFGAGNSDGALDASNMLKPALARSGFRCIGATTFDEYRKKIEKDKALLRRFQPVVVNEPSVEDTINILLNIKSKYEEYHNVEYTPEAISLAVHLSNRYIVDRRLPDKAIDLIDEAGAYWSSRAGEKPKNLFDLEFEIKRLEEEKKNFINHQLYDEAAEIRDKIKELRAIYNTELKSWQKNSNVKKVIIGKKEIEEVLSFITNVPVSILDRGVDKNKYLNMEEELKKVIIGQDYAIKVLSNAIKKNVAGIRKGNRPIGSFIFLGPTGVGKTALAKALAKFMFGSENDLIQLDMSEYMEKFQVSRIIGAPPGYVGYEAGGILTEKIKRKPYSVVLFDEIEKAHPDVFNILLQILDEGRLTDSFGNVVDFRNTVIIITSNIGTESFFNKERLGFLVDERRNENEREIFISEIKKFFRPELINRIDEIVIFNKLDKDMLFGIVNKLLSELNEVLILNRIYLNVSDDVKRFVIENGYEEKYGARSLIRAINRFIEIPATDYLLSYMDGELKEELVEIKVFLEENEIRFLIVQEKKGKSPKKSKKKEEKTLA